MSSNADIERVTNGRNSPLVRGDDLPTMETAEEMVIGVESLLMEIKRTLKDFNEKAGSLTVPADRIADGVTNASRELDAHVDDGRHCLDRMNTSLAEIAGHSKGIEEHTHASRKFVDAVDTILARSSANDPDDARSSFADARRTVDDVVAESMACTEAIQQMLDRTRDAAKALESQAKRFGWLRSVVDRIRGRSREEAGSSIAEIEAAAAAAEAQLAHMRDGIGRTTEAAHAMEAQATRLDEAIASVGELTTGAHRQSWGQENSAPNASRELSVAVAVARERQDRLANQWDGAWTAAAAVQDQSVRFMETIRSLGELAAEARQHQVTLEHASLGIAAVRKRFQTAKAIGEVPMDPVGQIAEIGGQKLGIVDLGQLMSRDLRVRIHKNILTHGEPFKSGRVLGTAALPVVGAGSAVASSLAAGNINLRDAGCPSDLPHIFRHLGVMNVSRVAMQESAYSNCSNLGSVRRTLFGAFRTLRANPKAESRKNCRVMRIEDRMVADFHARLKKLGDDTSIVLCGTVARAYFCKAGGREMSLCVYPGGLSHPSARQKNTWMIKKEMKALIRWMLHRAPSAN